MESVFDLQRHYHEERERTIMAMAKEMMNEKKMVKDKIVSDNKVACLMKEYLTTTEKLAETYQDRDKIREQERRTITSNDLTEFYSRLKIIKDKHKKNPNQTFVPLSVKFAEAEKTMDSVAESLVSFSDEEGFGRFLDLHEFHRLYVNLREMEAIDYISYLRTFDRLFAIPKDKKFSRNYKRYIGTLLDYLRDFVARAKPLVDHQEVLETVRRQFEANWKENKFAGWERGTIGALSFSGGHLDLTEFSSVEQLEELGGDRLKSALKALGLKCGGTVTERATRLFSTKGKDKLPSSLFTRDGRIEEDRKETEERARDIAWTEAQIYSLVEQLSLQRQSTIENVQRKQAQAAVGDMSSEEEVASEHEDEPEEDHTLYNPKNVPLGWDGKPIPYWLYKLHGLNQSFPCEICGNYVYRGPKAFLMHFAEWRHAHGMRCLGIPNTSHFASVVKIEEALELWARIKVDKDGDRWRGEVEEEFEDSMGNVVTRKTYEDLKRQGLL